MNIVMLVGRLTRDPSYREMQGNNGELHIASFYLAVPRNHTKDVNYIKITAFGQQAEFARDYLTKGKRIAVSGELMIGSYVDEVSGKKVYPAEVVAGRLEFADGKTNTQNQEDGLPDGFMNIPDGLEDELPFR